MASSKNIFHRTFGLDAEQHGKNEVVIPSESVNLQVINLGLSRTGTTSVDHALEELGFGPGHQGVVLYRVPEQNKAFTQLFKDIVAGKAGPVSTRGARLRKLTRGYRSAGDGPINCLVEESLAAYPNAKFILTLRQGGKDPWWKSFSGAMGVHFCDDVWRFVFRTLIYPVGFIRRQDNMTQAYKAKVEKDLGVAFGPDLYTKHNERVRRLVPKERLLEYNVREGWEPLCKFLGVEVPERAFPSVNDAESMRKIYFGMQAFGGLVWAVYISGVAGILYLAFSPSFARLAVESAANLSYFVQRQFS